MKKLKNFQKFALSAEQASQVKGGLSACRTAAPHACEAGGYTPGSYAFRECMVDIYSVCD